MVYKSTNPENLLWNIRRPFFAFINYWQWSSQLATENSSTAFTQTYGLVPCQSAQADKLAYIMLITHFRNNRERSMTKCWSARFSECSYTRKRLKIQCSIVMLNQTSTAKLLQLLKTKDSELFREGVHTTLCQRWTLFSPTHIADFYSTPACCISVM